ncbi:uncharacterized protein KZ484_008716 [Pholidichthys leucotaenia]
MEPRREGVCQVGALHMTRYPWSSSWFQKDVPQQNGFNQEEVLDEQQLLNKERNFIVVQVRADCSQIKEEQEDVCISQEREQFGLKQETQTIDEDVPQQNGFNQEEVLDEQHLLNKERNFIVVQVGADCSQIKEEQEDVCISQESEQFGLKQETQTFEDAPQLHDCKEEEEVLTFQQICDQERNSILNQEQQDAAQVKEEEEEFCST